MSTTTMTSKLAIRCDDCGLVTPGLFRGDLMIPPADWTTVHVRSTSEHGGLIAFHFCPRCTVTVEAPSRNLPEPGFIDDKW